MIVSANIGAALFKKPFIKIHVTLHTSHQSFCISHVALTRCTTYNLMECRTTSHWNADSVTFLLIHSVNLV